MQDKFSMPQEYNISFAKRMLVDSIYKSANLEGIAVTFAQTNDILNNVNVGSLKPNEIRKVCDMRDGWEYVIQHINEPLHLGFLEDIHALIAKENVEYWELGVPRFSDVGISGTTWRPELPNVEKLHNELQELLTIENVTDRAISVMLWTMRSQIFQDGNKRVASLTANKIMIENGKGIISIPVELDGTFKTMLVQYYETNQMQPLKEWGYEHCVDVRYALMIAVGFGIIVSIVIQFIAEPIVGLFTTDEVVKTMGGQYLRGYIFDCVFAGMHFSFSGYFCAYGRSEFSFLHNITSILLVRIPGVYLTSKLFPASLFPMGIGRNLP